VGEEIGDGNDLVLPEKEENEETESSTEYHDTTEHIVSNPER
jgi:hypothetical protein